MPSLPVNPSYKDKENHVKAPEKCKCNYHAFLSNIEEIASLPQRVVFLKFGGFLGLILLLSWLVMGPLVTSLDLVSQRAVYFYKHEHLRYVQYALINLIYGFNSYVILKCTVIDVGHSNSQSSKWRHILLLFLVVVSSYLNMGVTCVLWLFRNDLPNVAFLCTYLYCEYMSFYLFYLNVFGLMFPCLVSLFFYRMLVPTPKVWSDNPINTSDYSLELLQESGAAFSPKTSQFFLNLCAFLWIMIFGATVFVAYVSAELESSYAETHFEQVYLILLIVMIVLKWALKKISRQLDRTRLQYTNFSAKESSLEIMTEFVMSYLYWDVYRYLFISENIQWNNFIYTKSLHVLSELFETGLFFFFFFFKFCTFFFFEMKSFRSTDWYFTITQKWQDNKWSRQWLIQSGLIQDANTSHDQWKVRYCIDIMLHFTASWLDGIGWIVILTVHHSYLANDLGINVGLSFLFLIASMLIDAFIMMALYLWFWWAYSIDMVHLVCALFVLPTTHTFRWQLLWALVFLYTGYAQCWFFPDNFTPL
ncbi:hypothetical protein RFI_39275 [Reticulomyxa filosa]|uniref:Uncharacterized protein n=1 Tax=Reticulomyxa filosa TaxID=46433 RepID=X6LA38_RETFI|nr:hypothetical protein RFI_39275 [Reticulomyxa filosa]|eukprot:ETN98235.1 hypothetical protein RFI_39275 [Reticulomyxa filosa]